MANNNGKLRKKDSARLVWDTKPRRAPNPKDIEFQTAEVVLPNPKVVGDLPLSFRDGVLGEEEIDKQKMNRLIWGDNLLAMQALLAQGYEGKINLIYNDPPFDSKADYSHKMKIESNEFTKEPSVIERLAYKDTWSGGTDSYLDMLYPRLQLMKRLLAEDGGIYIHSDWHVGHYVKVMMDEIFGKNNFVNEVVWCYEDIGSKEVKYFKRKHDVLFLYQKSDNRYFQSLRKRLSQSTIERYGKYFDKNGKITYRWMKENNPGVFAKLKGIPDNLDEAWLDINKGQPLSDWWVGISPLKSHFVESVGYDTQKPEALLKNIIISSCPESGIVLDVFAGSGTTGVVAENLARQWIMCELGKVGIQVTRTRLVEIRAKPFIIENIGNYQREMIYLTGGRIWEMQHLILKLYGATPRDKMSGLGIRKVDNIDELVYVGYPDRPITAKKAEELALQAQNLDGRGYRRLVILGWDYEYNYSQALESRLNAMKDKIKIEIKSRDIPPDIYDYLKKAKSEEDIESLSDKVIFYERPYLKIGIPQSKELANSKVQVTLQIDRYVLMDIPVSHTSKKGQSDYSALMKLAKDNFAVLIDYWAVDWDYDGCTFKSQWQAFRGNGRKAKAVPVTATETLQKKKNRTIAVRVVDIFGNDAAATVNL